MYTMQGRRKVRQEIRKTWGISDGSSVDASRSKKKMLLKKLLPTRD
jgi:hypothetical protein